MHSTVVLCVVLALSALGCSASKRDNSSTARQGAIAGANVGQTKVQGESADENDDHERQHGFVGNAQQVKVRHTQYIGSQPRLLN